MPSINSVIQRGALGVSRRYDVAGLPVWHFLPPKSEGPTELARVSAAIQLIRDRDPRRFQRLRRDLRGIWIVHIVGAGEYEPELHLCKLDPTYVQKTDVTVVAATIIHEATHARLWRFGYDSSMRSRIERLCLKEEIAFASRLNDSSEVLERAEHFMARVDEAWSDEAYRRATIEHVRELKIPSWIRRCLERLLSRPAA